MILTILTIFGSGLILELLISTLYGYFLRLKGRKYAITNLKIFQSDFIKKETAFILGLDLSKTIYTSRNYKNNFTLKEFKSLMLHEYGHIRLYHGVIASIFRMLSISLFITLVLNIFFGHFSVFLLILFFLSFYLFISSVRYMEYQADEFVLKMRMGGVLAEALKKKKDSKYNLMHPSREKRYKNMLKILNG